MRSCSGSGPRISKTRRSRTATRGRGSEGRVEMREALGSEVLVHFTIAAPAGGHRRGARARRGCRRRPRRRPARRRAAVRTRRRSSGVSARARGCAEGESAEVVVDQRACTSSTPQTGQAIPGERDLADEPRDHGPPSAGTLTKIGCLCLNIPVMARKHGHEGKKDRAFRGSERGCSELSDRIASAEARDIRFPTSRWLDGSDAMHTDPDYSAAYVVLRTRPTTASKGTA